MPQQQTRTKPSISNCRAISRDIARNVNTFFLLFQGFNKDEGSIRIFALVANLTEAAIEEDPYGSFVYSATYLGRTYRVIICRHFQIHLAPRHTQ